MAYSVETVTQKIEESMPSLSPTTAKVMQVANDIEAPPSELTKVIKLDPVLSAKVLKLVNSSYFGLSNRIVSLEKAIIMLGLNTIKNLALSAAVLEQMRSKDHAYAFDSEAFWKHSLGVGVSSRLLAERRGVSKKEVEIYFIAGLLHDLGLLAENIAFPAEMERIALTAPEVGLVDAEEVILEGLNHCMIGKVLAEHWRLSEDLVGVIVGHHDPFADGDPPDLVLTTYAANIMCSNSRTGLVLERVPMEVEKRALEMLRVDAGAEAEITSALEREIEKAMEFLTT